ncbi:hypothetical protein [Petrotoga sp. 9PWA.NaAc.5.4]|nr:hypothetical protein [Petrotoga sp. 9PWA.NaAc.5.4]
MMGYQNLETVKLYGMLLKFKKIFDYKRRLMQQSFSNVTTTR